MRFPNPYFRIDTLHEDGAVRIALHGELDRSTLLTLARELLRLDREPIQILDLSDLSFVDVGGLKLMLATGRRLRAHGGQLTLANPSTSIRRLLSITAIDQTADVIDEVPVPG